LSRAVALSGGQAWRPRRGLGGLALLLFLLPLLVLFELVVVKLDDTPKSFFEVWALDHLHGGLAPEVGHVAVEVAEQILHLLELLRLRRVQHHVKRRVPHQVGQVRVRRLSDDEVDKVGAAEPERCCQRHLPVLVLLGRRPRRQQRPEKRRVLPRREAE